MEPLMIKNEGAEQRNKVRMEKLVNSAFKFTNSKHSFSDTYIQSRLYASRDAHTSIDDIVEAIRLAKLKHI